ncbi:MAG TPA: hypothetical protein VGE07_23275 [Herpetosiphonaceae bacterium]
MTHGGSSLTLNRLFVADLLAASAPCFALGLAEVEGQVTGCMVMRPAVPIPAASTNQGFRFGHRVLGRPETPVFNFIFHFYGHQTYHGLVPPSSPIVQAVLRRMLTTQDYLFFALNPDQTATSFRSELGDSNIAGLTTTFAQFGTGVIATDDYEQTVTAFTRQPDPPGLVVPWVCRDNPAYLDLTSERFDLNPAPGRPVAAPLIADEDEPAVIWQPVAMLPTVLRMAEEALDEAEAQVVNIRAALGRPGVLDRELVAHAQRVYGERQGFLVIYADQAERWAGEPLSRHQRAMHQRLEAVTGAATAATAELLMLLDSWAPPAAVGRPRRRAKQPPETILAQASAAMQRGDGEGALELLDEALDTPSLAPRWEAEYLLMRGTILRELGHEDNGIADYVGALAVLDEQPNADPLRVIDAVGLLGNALAFYDPEAAHDLLVRHVALVTEHRAAILADPEKRQTWALAPLGLAIVAEVRGQVTEAHRWYTTAHECCSAAQIGPGHHVARLIADGLARVAH